MQRTPKPNEKWKPMLISSPATRLRAACKIPPWMAKGNPIQPNVPPAPTEPPPFDPDYEVIEFPPAQQYTNAPLRPIDKHRSGQTNANHRCDLCGSSAPCVRCERCNNQTFCISCDDMYHRHPKRQNHVRKTIENKSQVLPPLPPKGEMFVPPVPPPRRHKRAPSRMTTPTPEEQNRQSRKEGSLMGSLKRFIGGRPLPTTPQMRDRRFLHSSTLPLSPGDFNDQPSSRDSGYLDWESDLNKHHSGSLTALNNSFFPPLMQAQSMAHLNCPSCHHQGMSSGMWDWGGRMNHFNSPSMAPWGGTPTGTWHGSQMLPSAYRQQNSPFDDTFWRRPSMPAPHPPSRNSNRSRRDLSQDSYEDESSKVNDRKPSFRASPSLSRKNYASSDSEEETASRHGRRNKSRSRQSREVSPALSRHSVRRPKEESVNRGRRFKKSFSRNVSPARSRKNSRRDLSDSDENNLPKSPEVVRSSPVLTRAKSKEEKGSRSSVESVKDSSSSENNLENQEKDIPFVPTVEWECQHCTFVNKAGSRVCAVCCKTTSVLKLKNKTSEKSVAEEEKLVQPIKELNISNTFPSSPSIQNDDLNISSSKSNSIRNTHKQRGKVLTAASSVDVNLDKAVISTGTSPPPQSISTQTYDIGGGKLRRAASLADHDLWKPPTRSVSRQSLMSDSMSLPMTPARTPDDDDSLLNFETQQPIKSQHLGRRSFDAVNQNVIRPSVRRAGSQPPEYLSTMVQKQVKQGLEMVKLLREAEQHHYSADDLSVALTHCGDNDPVAWLLDNWQNMIDTVVTLATNYGHERKENTIGTISVAEAREALRMHNGNVWAAVTECVEQRQKKYAELLSRGNFAREDIVTVLTANHGDLDAASRELNKSQLKPFLMRIWGPPQGIDNDSGDTSKLFVSDSFESADLPSEINRIKNSKEVSDPVNHYNATKTLNSELDLDDLSTEQLKILECTEALKNIHSSVYDDDVVSASLKLGLQNIIHQRSSNNHAKKGSELENLPFDTPEKLQTLSDCGVFKLPLSSLKGADSCVIFSTSAASEKKNVPTESRQSYAQKGFSHALKSNFQPYRTVSVCDLSDSNVEAADISNHTSNNNQINLSTIYYDGASKRSQRKGEAPNSSIISDQKNVKAGPQLYMEVSHETVNFAKNPEVETSKQSKCLESSPVREKSPSASGCEKESTEELSDSEVFYETSSVNCDKTDSGCDNAKQVEALNPPAIEHTYNVEFEKDLIFVASKTPSETNKTKSQVAVMDEKNFTCDNEPNCEKGEHKVESDSEPSISEKNDKSRSTSEDSSKDYQSVEENSPEILTKPKENPLNKTLVSNIPRPNFSASKSVEKSGARPNHEITNQKPATNTKDSKTKPKVSNFSAKPKKKPKRFVPKIERRSSVNNNSSKVGANNVNKSSKPSLISGKLPSSIPLSNFKAKSTNSLDRRSSQPLIKSAPKGAPKSTLRKIELKPIVNGHHAKKSEIESSPDCSADSDFKADQTIVHSEVLRVEPADIDCDDGNPHVLEVSRQEVSRQEVSRQEVSRLEVLTTDGVSLNSIASSQNNELNSSDSTMKNILSLSEDSPNADLCPLQRSSSADTHAGIESAVLDEGNDTRKSMVENRAEIIQLLRESMSDDQALQGIIDKLFSTMKESEQCQEVVEKTDDPNGETVELEIADKDSSKITHESHVDLSKEDLEIEDAQGSENEGDDFSQSSDELDIHRKARQFLAEGVVSSFEQAQLVVHLLELNFDQELSVSAAKECSNLETALSFLQQDCLLCTGKYPVKQMVSMLSCEHLCCQDCALNYFTLQITERSISDCVCPFCKEPNLKNQNGDYAMNYFSNLDILLKSFLQPQVHELFQRKLRDRTLMQDPNFKWCAQCSFGFIADLRQKRLTCPDCRAVSCAQCRRPWTKEHEGKTCTEYNEWQEANDPGALLAKQLVDQGVTCPACHSKYALVKGGCMHLTCPECKHEFCSDCSKTFLMGANCKVSPFCEKLGLHAHHPRNCLFFLRDKEPETLEKLLTSNEIEFDKKEKENKSCNVQLQRETSDGLVEGFCNYRVLKIGLCRTHYIEYLVTLISRHKLDPIVVFDLNEVLQELRRHGKVLPTRTSNATDQEYLNLCVKIVEEQVPLE